VAYHRYNLVLVYLEHL